jgi:hypothetical protein
VVIVALVEGRMDVERKGRKRKESKVERRAGCGK